MRTWKILAAIGVAVVLAGVGVAVYARSLPQQQASCLVGVPSESMNIQLAGDAGPVNQDCRDYLASAYNGEQFQPVTAPSGQTLCHATVSGVSYTVRDHSRSSQLAGFYCYLLAHPDGGVLTRRR